MPLRDHSRITLCAELYRSQGHGQQIMSPTVQAIHDVACVVPDIGGPLNRCFFVQPRPRWSKMFVEWVKAPHNEDDMSEEEFTESEEEDENALVQRFVMAARQNGRNNPFLSDYHSSSRRVLYHTRTG